MAVTPSVASALGWSGGDSTPAQEERGTTCWPWGSILMTWPRGMLTDFNFLILMIIKMIMKMMMVTYNDDACIRREGYNVLAMGQHHDLARQVCLLTLISSVRIKMIIMIGIIMIKIIIITAHICKKFWKCKPEETKTIIEFPLSSLLLLGLL